MTDIFISYSHKDEAWKDELQAHLSVLQQHGEFSVWDDRQIRLGDNWLPEIEQAINSAKVAILLVSRDFLTSEFIAQEEITKFLQLRQEGGLRVIPVIVRPCPWQAVSWLAELQGATRDNLPLSRFALGSHELEMELSQVALRVYGFLQEAREEEQQRLRAEAIAQEKFREQQLRLEKEKRAEAVRLQKEEAKRKEQAGIRQQEEERKRRLESERALSESAESERVQQPSFVSEPESVVLGGMPDKRRNWLLGGLTALVVGTGVVIFQSQYPHSNFSSLQNTVSNEASVGEGLKPEQVAAVVQATPAEASQHQVESERLPFEPEMVRLEGGTFQMGCVSGVGCQDDEKPVQQVTVLAFEIGKYEVTFAQWDECVAQGGCQHKPETNWGRGEQPVMRVSWNDAQEYVAWLSKKTGKQYRLPTEAEWEYAARGGTTSPFSMGKCINTDQANYNGNYGWEAGACGKTGKYHGQTFAVGRFAANDSGLFDMHGNVWEWVQDCYHESYKGLPTDASPWETTCSKGNNNVTYRVLRGGSWSYVPVYLRSANRNWYYPSFRNYDVGFRVARTL